MHYIYIDSKIEGTYKILINYFNLNIFDKRKFIVLIKNYKSIKKFISLLRKKHIPIQLISKWSDLPSLNGATVLYLFNAQSNCRLVNYREATHIFIGHGESNKLASAKPIFRIYDYIAVAGSASIDRFIAQDIFTQCDVKQKKFLKVGNKFIGEAFYSYDKQSKTLLYAPTWEGGIKEENYSSLNASLKNFELIIKYMKEHNYKEIIIQPHPNTGHREKKTIKYLLEGIKLLNKERFQIYLKQFKLPLFYKWNLNIKLVSSNEIKKVSVAFCDVSAMEIQLLEKEIPTYIFFTQAKSLVPQNEITKKYYDIVGIKNYTSPLKPVENSLLLEVKKYYIEHNINFSHSKYFE